MNGAPFTSYAADGVIVATPTGSTAYSFSARGPIVSPRLRCLLLTPVSPHMLFDRSLVLAAEETLRFTVCDDRSVVLTLDGRELGDLARGRHGLVHRRSAPGAHRHPRAARLPSDPQGQIRPRRPVASGGGDAGRAARRRPRHRRRPRPAARSRPDRHHRRDRRGQDAHRRSARAAGGRAGRRRRSCATGATKRASKAGSSIPTPATRSVLARVIPRDGRSRAYVDGRLATASELAELGATLVDLLRPARAPVVARPGGAARRARPVRGRARGRRARVVSRRACDDPPRRRRPRRARR